MESRLRRSRYCETGAIILPHQLAKTERPVAKSFGQMRSTIYCYVAFQVGRVGERCDIRGPGSASLTVCGRTVL